MGVRPVWLSSRADCHHEYSALPETHPAHHVFVSLFGASLTSFRLTTVIVTTGGLVVVYALVLHLLTVRVALLSVLLAAVLPVHIFFNRTALVNNIDPIIGMAQLQKYRVIGFAHLLVHHSHPPLQ